MKALYISLLIFLLPINMFAQWYYQNPTPPLPFDLKAIEIVSKDKILIANEEAKIYFSPDMGNSWGKINEQTFPSIVEIEFINDEKGILITWNSIYVTSDGGINWFYIDDPLPQETKAYFSLTYTNSLVGIITGDIWLSPNYPVGLILKTFDGGLTWSYLFTYSYDLIFKKCIFFDANNGIGITSQKIYSTTDGGINWIEKYSSNHLLNDISFIDNLNGVVVGGLGSNGYTHRTTDGGQTWNSVSVYGHLWNVTHVSEENIYAASTEYGLVYSKDGGLSWHAPNNYPANAHALFLDALNDSLIILIGNQGCVFKSIDGGYTVTQSQEGTKKRIRSVDCVSVSTGIVVGDSGLLMKTTNGGSAWIEEYLPISDNINSVDMIDEQKVIVVTESGNIYKSTDSGISWELNSFQVNHSLNSIKMYDENYGAIVGNDNSFYYTTNAGEEWYNGMLPVGSADLNDLCYLEFSKIILVGDHIIYRSSDGGSSWESHTLNKELFSIAKLNSNTAVTCGAFNLILKTTDSGNNWNEINNPHPGETFFYSVSFADEFTGKLAAGRERIYKSSDSGESWQLDIDINVSTVSGDLLSEVYMINSSNAIAVGKYGLILSTIRDHVVTIDPNDEINFRYQNVIEFLLSQNYPNPFNPATSIQYAISSPQFVVIKVYDLLGREITTLINEEKPSGIYQVEFNAANLPSGIYFYRLQAGDYINTKKMVLLR